MNELLNAIGLNLHIAGSKSGTKKWELFICIETDHYPYRHIWAHRLKEYS